jgi:hypothetical protein
MRRSVAIGIGVALAALAFVQVAMAGSGSSDDGYGGAAGAVQGQVQKGGNTLPFTGFDLTMAVVVAVLLVAAGFGIRRLGQRRS